MRALLAKLFKRQPQPDHTFQVLANRPQPPVEKLHDPGHGTPILVRDWSFRDAEHFRFLTELPDFAERRNCILCSQPMVPLTQVENYQGLTSLETGYCIPCDFIQHTKSPTPPWK